MARQRKRKSKPKSKSKSKPKPKPELQQQKGKGKGKKKEQEMPQFNIYLGKRNDNSRATGAQLNQATQLLQGVWEILLGSESSLRHLASMTLEGNPTPEALVERMEDIKEYLTQRFPDLCLTGDTRGAYGFTPDPFDSYDHPRTRSQTSRFKLTVSARRTLCHLICLNDDLYSLYERSSRTKHMMQFLLEVVILHELAHVVIYTFGSQHTPVKFHGHRVDETSTHGDPRGEVGDSLEAIMTGGVVALGLPSDDDDPRDADPDMVLIDLISREGYRVIGLDTPPDLLHPENWQHISAQIEPKKTLPVGYKGAKLKPSPTSEPGPSSPSRLSLPEPEPEPSSSSLTILIDGRMYTFPFEPAIRPSGTEPCTPVTRGKR